MNVGLTAMLALRPAGSNYDDGGTFLGAIKLIGWAMTS